MSISPQTHSKKQALSQTILTANIIKATALEVTTTMNELDSTKLNIKDTAQPLDHFTTFTSLPLSAVTLKAVKDLGFEQLQTKIDFV